MLWRDGAQRGEEGVINSACKVEKSPADLLYEFIPFVIEYLCGVGIFCIFYFDTLVERCVWEMWVPMFDGDGLVEVLQSGFDVS